ncbi:small acid-soluble spore protein I (minor) [Paenibacillus sp. V4I7]|nr:small acid-soluble spore protein I (minor) [Paenibacillus sp. V4I7]
MRILITITTWKRGPQMNITLRQAIVQRVQNKSNNELQEVIEDSIGGEERVLPGLGVLFEIIWQHSEANIQNQLVETLKEHLE